MDDLTTHLDMGISREEFMQKEWERKEIARHSNAPEPECCPKCKGELKESGGYVGETVLYCPNDECDQGIAWEDAEDAIRRVI